MLDLIRSLLPDRTTELNIKDQPIKPESEKEKLADGLKKVFDLERVGVLYRLEKQKPNVTSNTIFEKRYTIYGESQITQRPRTDSDTWLSDSNARIVVGYGSDAKEFFDPTEYTLYCTKQRQELMKDPEEA